MIENDRQYLITYRQVQEFSRAIDAAWGAAQTVPDGNESTLALALFDSLNSQHYDLCGELADYDRRTAADRKGSWMPTWTGHRFWLLDPRPQDIHVEDIAQGLSRISRYNGMTLGPVGYTVAQHSVLASLTVPPPFALAVLMHDAPEAFAGDVISPLKELLGKAYEDIEDRIMRAVSERFSFLWDDPDVQRQVHFADKTMLATEVRDLVPARVIRVDPRHDPLPTSIAVWSQETAKAAFLQRFKELYAGE